MTVGPTWDRQWTGDVWKVLDTDWGVGVVRRRTRRGAVITVHWNVGGMTYAELTADVDRLLGLRGPRTLRRRCGCRREVTAAYGGRAFVATWSLLIRQNPSSISGSRLAPEPRSAARRAAVARA